MEPRRGNKPPPLSPNNVSAPSEFRRYSNIDNNPVPGFASYRSSIDGVEPSISDSSLYQSPSPQFTREGGLAPRPPSMRYNGKMKDAVGNAGPATKHKFAQGISSQLGETLLSPDDALPPAAPDVPPAPPPVSYRGPSGRDFHTPYRARGRASDPKAEAILQYRESLKRNYTPSSALEAPVEPPELRSVQKDRAVLGDPNYSPQTKPTAINPSDPYMRYLGKSRTNGHNKPISRKSENEAQREPIASRDWASDRSPLQKLEVTLTDIAKEEKRAQVEEAELIARDARTGRGGRRISRLDAKNGSVDGGADPVYTSLADAGLVRRLSDHQARRIQNSASLTRPRVSQGPETTYRVQGFEYAKPLQREPAMTTNGSPSGRDGSSFRTKEVGGSSGLNSHTTRGSRSVPSKIFDDWKSGKSARLTSLELNLEKSKPKAERKREDPNITPDKTWWEGGGSGRKRDNGTLGRPEASSASRAKPINDAFPKSFQPPLHLKCGPLLRYRGLRRERPKRPSRDASKNDLEIWMGSVMIVTEDTESSYELVPTLRLFCQPVELLSPPPTLIDDESNKLDPAYIDPIAGFPKLSRNGRTLYVRPVEHLEEGKDLSGIENDEGLFEKERSPSDYVQGNSQTTNNPKMIGMDGEYLDKYKEVQGIRLHAERGLTFWRFNIEVELGSRQARIAYRINYGLAIGFWVPAHGDSMNIMFHSCNGFSANVEPDKFSGPDPLWRDVLNTHQTCPFHVMVGGGDQIYQDSNIKKSTLFQDWLSIKTPHHKHTAKFTPKMKEELEMFYLEYYATWFSQGLFSLANAQIPMVNIWDDHDIIDGFGSYPDSLMSSPVFKGIGAIAFKYYMLFQHQSVVDEGEDTEPSWLLGVNPGPYIVERSRNLFMPLGRKILLLGLDCRTERTRDEVLTEESYAKIFNRCRRDIVKGETQHLIVILGIPAAYPRLVWLENILTSRIMDPVKALGRAGLLGGLLNQFDSGVEILDDLDDHWTAKNHKGERNWLIQELQDLAAEKSVRITILSGDVHLAAVGQFYSNPKLGLPKDRDHRYMPNVISSAIVNAPPPEIMGDILNKRNKIHHLDDETDEDMIPLFSHDVDGKPRNNQRLLPRRNWCSIKEYNPGATPPSTPSSNGSQQISQDLQPPGHLTRTLSLTRKDISPGGLFRRLSQRGSSANNIHTAISRDKYPNLGIPPPLSNNLSTNNHSSPNRGSSVNSNITPTRRPFHRQVTDLREKKRNMLSLNPNAYSEEDVHINLEGGLDIVLNLEVSPKDPSGITTPYRLLVPALEYQDFNNSHSPHLKKSGGLKWPSWARGKKESPQTIGHEYGIEVSPPPHFAAPVHPNESKRSENGMRPRAPPESIPDEVYSSADRIPKPSKASKLLGITPTITRTQSRQTAADINNDLPEPPHIANLDPQPVARSASKASRLLGIAPTAQVHNTLLDPEVSDDDATEPLSDPKPVVGNTSKASRLLGLGSNGPTLDRQLDPDISDEEWDMPPQPSQDMRPVARRDSDRVPRARREPAQYMTSYWAPGRVSNRMSAAL
ncbi:MAG: hypothetical protein M1829_003358 [Trizodia sp. TS-e1964]|nr:MAG: hypothetical protein M1829_003358 [Trizodia sp. TS-e1964]